VADPILSVVVIGDTHAGDKTALCLPESMLDYNVGFTMSAGQQQLYAWWKEFQEQIPAMTRRRKFLLLHGGDIVEGVHHRSTSTLTNNLTVMEQLAVDIMRPLVNMASAYVQVAGTPVHDGESWCWANRVAQDLGAIPYELPHWHVHPEFQFRLGDALVHDTHHIGVSGMHRTQQTAIASEVVEQITDAGLDGGEAPMVVLRHHSHGAHIGQKYYRDGMFGYGIKVPSWKLKGPFAYHGGARNMTPHFGGYVLNWITRPWGQSEVEVVPFIRSIGRPKITPITLAAPRRRK